MNITLEFNENKNRLDIGLGIAIILKYDPTTELSVVFDEMWIGDYRTTYAKMTELERAVMAKGNWDEDEDSWHRLL